MSETTPRGGVIVGVDGSARSVRAVEWAAESAQEAGLGLTVCNVHPEAGSALGYPSIIAENERRSRSEDTVERAVQAAQRVAPGLQITRAVEVGHVAERLMVLARSHRMLVVGSHGHRWLNRMFAGSVAVQVASHAPCPVVVVHGSLRAEGPVLVGVDGSGHSQAALDVAFQHAATHNLPLKAIHTYELPSIGERATSLAAEIIDYYRDEASRTLAEAIEPWTAKFPSVPVESDILVGPAGEILADASKAASLLVVGSRGTGGFRGLLLGSVSRHVVNDAACPVLVVR